MRILILSDYGVPLGGAEIQMLRLRHLLRARGHEARIFASTAFARDVKEPRADYWCRGSGSSARTLLQVANVSAYTRLGSVLREFRPHVVHVAMHLTQLSPLVLARLREVPSLYHAQWYRAVCPLGTKRLPSGRACREPWGGACLRNGCLPGRDWPLLMLQLRAWHRWRDVFDLVVTNSEATRRMLAAAGVEPAEVVWNGISIPARPTPPAGEPRVVFAGRLVAEKGADVLLRAFALGARQVSAATLTVAGDGPMRGSLERLAAELGIGPQVLFTGRLEADALERRAAGAWVHAVPSLWEEPFGLVAAEAMARGAPVVASDAGGLREIVVHGETGFLVPPGDAEALASALVELLRDRSRAGRMGRAARARAVDHFGEEQMVDRFLDIYRRLTGGGQEPADASTAALADVAGMQPVDPAAPAATPAAP